MRIKTPKLNIGIPNAARDVKRPMSFGKQALTPPKTGKVPKSMPRIKPKQPRLKMLPNIRGLGGLGGM